ncbi:MAG: hypothetical protein PHT40_00605 [Patescibacteria group bacterium]|nr:hypothetical protein [Patescibacteria group bacterium]
MPEPVAKTKPRFRGHFSMAGCMTLPAGKVRESLLNEKGYDLLISMFCHSGAHSGGYSLEFTTWSREIVAILEQEIIPGYSEGIPEKKEEENGLIILRVASFYRHIGAVVQYFRKIGFEFDF